MARWRLQPLVGDLVVEMRGPDPLGCRQAERQLVEAGYEPLVVIRPDRNYASSGCHRPDDPTCRFRVYQCCFRAWRVPGAVEERRPLPAPRQISRPHATDLFLLGEYLVCELFHGRRVAIWFHAVLEGVGGIAEEVREAIRGALEEVVARGPSALYQRWRTQPQRLRTHAARHKAWLPTLQSHATSLAGLGGILASGALLPTTEIRGVPGSVLARRRRNMPCDPPDYFEHIMFMLGDDGAIGDWVVYQRLVDRSPTDPTHPLTWQMFEDDFRAAAKLFFASSQLLGHPWVRSDGFHDLKVRGRLALTPFVAAVVLPKEAPNAATLVDLAWSKGLGHRLIQLSSRGLTPRQWASRAHDAALARYLEDKKERA